MGSRTQRLHSRVLLAWEARARDRVFDQNFGAASRLRAPGECARDLLDTAARLLRPGGRLVFFMPAAPGAGGAGDAPAHPALALVSSCEQARAARAGLLWPPPVHCAHTLMCFSACTAAQTGLFFGAGAVAHVRLVCPGPSILEHFCCSATPFCACYRGGNTMGYYWQVQLIARRTLHMRDGLKVEVKHSRPSLRMQSGWARGLSLSGRGLQVLSSRYSRRLITLEKVRCVSEHTIHLTCVTARQRVATAPGTAVAVEDHMCA